MLKKLISCFSLLFPISQTALSNNSPLPGYYISKNGDTVRCTVEYGDWNRNPKTVQFLVNNEPKEFGPDDIRGFGVEGYDEYISATVIYHTGVITGGNYPPDFSKNILIGNLFLKVLESGDYPLYSFVNDERIYYFYNRPEGSITELLYRMKMADGKPEEDPSFRQQIFNLFEMEDKTERYLSRINSASYNSTDISYLFTVLNGNSDKDRKNNNAAYLQPEFFLGAILNNFPATFNGQYMGAVQANPFTTVAGGFNLLISTPGKFKSFKLGLGLGYNQYEININKSWTTDYVYPGDVYTTHYTENITAKNSMLFTNFYLMWMINPLGKVQAYMKAGGSYHFSLNSDQNVVTSYTTATQGVRYGVPYETTSEGQHPLIQISGNYLSFVGSAGLTFGRHSFELSYSPPADIVGSVVLPPTQHSFSIGSMGIFYYFSLTEVKKGRP